ncbi:hypothetical protein AAFF_G00227030 [Aldrovandia affinis]|uniref:C2H2-type domain-containing protein n=1 Tax=Aldrovandia affinis TaxID=143900 RepID=A0AAD7TBH0_9TELE|nr:hypothetical protein AAFF_G00227030 [Aldrovandia affinis]
MRLLLLTLFCLSYLTRKGGKVQSLPCIKDQIVQNCQIILCSLPSDMEETGGGVVLVSHTKGQQGAVFASEAVVAVDTDLQQHNSDNGQKVCRQAEDSLFQVIKKLSKIVEKHPRRCPVSGRKRPRLPCGPIAVLGSQDESGRTPLKKAKDPEGYLAEGALERTVTLYQCSLCSFTCLTLPLLKDHLQQHNQPQSNIILACSECSFISGQQMELEAHIRVHLGTGDMRKKAIWEPPSDVGKEQDYPGEEMGGIQVVKDANASSGNKEDEPTKKKWYSQERYGTYKCLICSYVCEQQRMLKTHAWKHAGLVDCSYPIFEDGPEEPSAPTMTPPSLPEEAAVVLAVPSEGKSAAEAVPGFVVMEEPAVEVRVTMETDAEQDLPGSDSLLSSVQEIINSSPDTKEHRSVIVEHLPGAREPPASALFLIPPGMGVNTRPLEEEEEVDEVSEAQEEEAPEVVVTDEDVPPARRRTQSESLRLHSLAAEALAAMPMRASKAASANGGLAAGPCAQNPDSGLAASSLQKPSCPSEGPANSAMAGSDPHARSGQAAAEGPAKAGISLSLLTVIEKLRERTNENASDEDILRELRGDAGLQPGDEADLPEGGLLEVHRGSDRPYRCCCYASANQGRAKQHLRAHGQRQPCQGPVCEHVARDSKDLEDHKVRMHSCKPCREAACYKSQLRNHEEDQHGGVGSSAAVAPVTETMVTSEDSLEKTTVMEASQAQKMYRCDVCDFTSSTYVGVRNHRRIHNSEKPYKCCSCDFATANMNSLKSHMRRHPQEHQTVQLLEQYRCSLCGYVCSHPPSLKSHMWKHAGDQNYNYEQVTRAIDQAISQSGRALGVAQNPVPEVEPLDRAFVAEDRAEKTLPGSDLSRRASDHVGAGGAGMAAEANGTLVYPGTTGAEYCMLLFCCCICGFESPSKERIMEHMRDHEGEIISIILSKDQLAVPPAGH